MKGCCSKIARRFSRLPPFNHLSDVALFIKVLSFASVVPLLLRFDLPKVRRWLEPRKAYRTDLEKADKINDYVEAAIQFGRPLVRDVCLTRGLSRYYFLRRAGIEVTLHFGVGQINNGYAGHCWLVKDGEPFLEKEDPRPLFRPVYTMN